MRKLARFHSIRNLVQYFQLHSQQIPLEKSHTLSSIFTGINIDEIISSLEEHGIFQGLVLPKYIISDILEFTFTAKCYGDSKYNFGFSIQDKNQAESYYKRKFISAKYYNLSQECSSIKLLENDEGLLEIARRYLKIKPVHIGTSMWWNFPINREYIEHAQVPKSHYHCDLDDYNFVKFFFYLTDVDINSGPHVYVQGSHKNKKIIYQILRGRTNEANLINDYGSENIITICGSAGWGFVEDTFGCHKGIPPTHNPRLILQIEFATKDYNMQHDIVSQDRLQAI